MKNDWWKWTAAFMSGVALTLAGAYITAFICFEKNAVPRPELLAALATQKIEYQDADLALRSEMRSVTAGLERQYGEVRAIISTMQSDVSQFKTESTADRRGLAVKVDTILQILTAKSVAGQLIPYTEKAKD